MMTVTIEKQHQWLQKFVGEWTYETQARMGPNEPPTTFGGTETVRAIGGIWIVAEGRCQMPGGEMGTTLLTLGYDAQKERFVGTWLGSMMNYLWVYDGSLDAAGNALTLDTQGPNCMGGGKIATFKEVVELRPDGQRRFTSSMRGDDGTWATLMTATYQRVK